MAGIGIGGSGPMITDPSMLGSSSGIPGANFGGSNIAVPGASGASGGGTLGDTGNNPLNPAFPSGQGMPDISSLLASINAQGFGANSTAPGFLGSGSPSNPSNSGMNIFQLSGGQPGTQSAGKFFSNLITGFKNAGFGSAQGSLLANFLLNGAGFNQNAVNAILAEMQPTINRGEADIMEWLGSHGNSASSSAAGIGLGDYLSQVQLNEGAIISNMYEQSVQDYLNVLMGSKQTQHGPDLLSQVMGVLSTLSGIGGTSTGGGGTLAGDIHL